MKKTALQLIADERQRQIEVEGYTPEHDDSYMLNEMALAAAYYAAQGYRRQYGREFNLTDEKPPFGWPWADECWKPTPNDPIRELTKAGALIIAEIERLQRKEEGNA